MQYPYIVFFVCLSQNRLRNSWSLCPRKFVLMFPKTRLRKSKQPWRQQVALWFWSKSKLSSHSTARPTSPLILLFCHFFTCENGGSLAKRKKCLQTLLLSLKGIECGSMPETELTGTQPGQMAALLFLCSFVCSHPSDPLCSKYDLQKHRPRCQVHLSILLLVCLFNFSQKNESNVL